MVYSYYSLVVEMLEQISLHPESLELEITESMIMKDLDKMNKLKELDCDEAQGYYFSNPVTGEEFTCLLKDSVKH